MASAINPTDSSTSSDQQQANALKHDDTISWDTRPTPKHVPSLTPEHAFPKTESPKTHAPEHKRYQDVLAYEDKWIGWDGPVWCSRYGRFENQEDAAADDGYRIKGGIPHEGKSCIVLVQLYVAGHLTERLDLGLEHCEKHGCSCRVPFQHRSYVKDIQRRVEPMVESLVRLENQVGKLVHHLIKDGESFVHTGHGSKSDPGAKRFDETSDPNRFQRPLEPIEDSLAKLEARVESLMHQVQHIMKNHDDRFMKYGQNIVPPSHHEAKHNTPPSESGYDADPRQFFQGGR